MVKERPRTAAGTRPTAEDSTGAYGRARDSQPEDGAEALPDFCGRCSNCVRIGQADDLEARFAEAVEARDGLRETDKRETRIFVQTYSDVMVIPPDPPQMMVKVDQVRHLTATIYYKPAEGRQKVYIFPNPTFVKGSGQRAAESAGRAPGVCDHLPAGRKPGDAAAHHSLTLRDDDPGPATAG